MSITAGYCILAVMLIRLAFRQVPRKYLYALWLVVAFRLVCPVSVSAGFSLFNLPQFGQSAPVTDAGAMEYIPERAGTQEDPEIYTGLTPMKETGNPQRVFWLEAGKYVWLLGMLGFCLYFVRSIRKLSLQTERAVPVSEMTGEKEKTRRFQWKIYECDELASPFTMGVHPPRIYLPCGLRGEARRMVLLHEQCHIRRGDHLVKLFAFLLLAVYWFHPLIWAAWFGMCRDMEMSCDEKVLEELGEKHKKDYSMTLLSFASGSHGGSSLPLAFGEHDVKRRIRHSLRFKKRGVWAAVLAAGLIGISILLLGTNGEKRKEDITEAQEYSEKAAGLFEARNLYVGDASANGRLAGAIAAALPDSAFGKYAFKTQLQTSEEPYEYHYILDDTLEEEPYFWTMAAPATLMLALTDNLGVVEWSYDSENGNVEKRWGLEDAEEWCQAEDLKAYAESPEKLQELLDILETHKQDEGLTGHTDPGGTMQGTKESE